MTTIAITDTEIAADTLSMFGDMKHALDKRKIIVRDGHIFAICGFSDALESVITWYLAGHDAGKVPEKSGDWNLIVIAKDQEPISFASDLPYPSILKLPVCFGTGEKYAQGALDVGASASDAVAAAIKRDPQSGGEVMCVRFSDVFTDDEAPPLKMAEAAE